MPARTDFPVRKVCEDLSVCVCHVCQWMPDYLLGVPFHSRRCRPARGGFRRGQDIKRPVTESRCLATPATQPSYVAARTSMPGGSNVCLPEDVLWPAVEAAFDPFIRFVRQAAATTSDNFEAVVRKAWPCAYKPAAEASPPAVLGKAFLKKTVKRWHDGAVATAAGCMLRFLRTGRRGRDDICYALALVEEEIKRCLPAICHGGMQVVKAARGQLAAAVHLALEGEAQVAIARTTTSELTTECFLNSTVVRQAFTHMQYPVSGYVRPRAVSCACQPGSWLLAVACCEGLRSNTTLAHVLCRTPREGQERVARVGVLPDTFVFQADAPIGMVVHEAKVRGSAIEGDRHVAHVVACCLRWCSCSRCNDRNKLIVMSAGVAGAAQLGINKAHRTTADATTPLEPGRCTCFSEGHQETVMPIPLIQTVGSTFCMYAGKTIHSIDGSCAQKVNGVLLVTPLCGC